MELVDSTSREADHSLPFSPEVKNCGGISQLSHIFSWRSVNFAQGNVYFYFDKLHGVTSQKRVIYNVAALSPPNKHVSLLVILIDIVLTSILIYFCSPSKFKYVKIMKNILGR